MRKIKWKATPGVGDFMMGLNVAHHLAFTEQQQVELEVHWYHDKDHLHSFEDPETIVERFEYAHNFYRDKDKIKVSYVFNSDNSELWVKRYIGVNYSPTPRNKISYWMHRKDSFLPVNDNKVVVWRPTFNAEMPRSWKMLLSEGDWNEVISILKDVYGYDVVELCYRVPISEVYYHMNTCAFAVGYDGMWHYVARNFLKPMLIASDSKITQFHTPNAVMMNKNTYRSLFSDLENSIDTMNKENEIYKRELKCILTEL